MAVNDFPMLRKVRIPSAKHEPALAGMDFSIESVCREILEVVASCTPWVAEWSVRGVGNVAVAVGVDYVVSQRLQVIDGLQ